MRIHDLTQRSEEWDKFREGKIGASVAGVILNLSPYKSPYYLWKEMMGIIPREPLNSAMQRGMDLEDVARKKIEEETGVMFIPIVAQHEDLDWMIASLDGINQDKGILLEVKCPGEKQMKAARRGHIPAMYYAQMQHQMTVTGYDLCYYWVFDGEDGVKMDVKRNDDFIRHMVEEEERFYNALVEMEPLYEWM